MQFTELQLDERTVRALAEAGIETCTRVQEETLVHSLKGRDITAQSQTGTGKTIAFLVTAFQRSVRGDGVGARTLIVAPTRELAVQIEKEAQLVGQYLPHKIGSFYGGVGYGDQERMLREGVDVVIGTPGRLLDYASSGRLDFRTFGIIVIDEADRLFDMGFIPDLRRIMRGALPPTERQTMLFSATLGERVKQLAWEYMNEPISVEVEPEVVTVREVSQVLYHVSKEEKMRLLLGLLKRDKPQKTLIFTNTKHAAETVSRRLEINGFHCRYIMGDLPQSKRLSLITDMKAGKIPILVATDVAARGLHIDDVDLVVNYDLPEDRESYVHRIGRTARAGKSGKAVSLACERFVYSLEGIETFINMKIPTETVSSDLLLQDASAGMGFGRTSRTPVRGGRSGGSDRRGGGGGGGGRGGRGERRPAPRDRGERADRGEHADRGERPDRGERKPVGAGGNRRPSQGQGSGGQSRRPPARKPASGPGRVSRDTPLEERAAHYRDKHDRAEEPAGDRPPSRSGSGGQRRDRPSPRAATPPPPPPTTPPAKPPARPSVLDKLRGLLRRKPGKGKGEGETPRP